MWCFLLLSFPLWVEPLGFYYILPVYYDGIVIGVSFLLYIQLFFTYKIHTHTHTHEMQLYTPLVDNLKKWRRISNTWNLDFDTIVNLGVHMGVCGWLCACGCVGAHTCMFVHVYKSKLMCLHTLCLRKKVKERERGREGARERNHFMLCFTYICHPLKKN